MRVIWTATTRVSRSGKIIGEDQRLTVYEALKCITDWSAYQHFEDDIKGTLEAGKLADMVILDKNPLKVSEEEIKEIMWENYTSSMIDRNKDYVPRSKKPMRRVDKNKSHLNWFRKEIKSIYRHGYR